MVRVSVKITSGINPYLAPPLPPFLAETDSGTDVVSPYVSALTVLPYFYFPVHSSAVSVSTPDY